MTLRRQFELLPDDRQFLEEYGLPWETIVDGSQWVLVHEFPTHEGYNHPRVTAAVRMETGYPNTELNMVYFSPGAPPERRQSHQGGRRHAAARRQELPALVAAPHAAEPVEARPGQSRHARHPDRGLASAGV